LSSASQP